MTANTPVPTKRQILDFINESPTPVGKREIARAFGMRGSDRIALKSVLKELQDEGLLDRGRKRQVRPAGALPPVVIIEVVGIDSDGEVLCKPARWDEETPPPTIYLRPGRRRTPAPGKGDRVLANVERTGKNTYTAEAIRVLGAGPKVMLGIYEQRDHGGVIRPTTRGRASEYSVAPEDRNGAENGEVVTIELLTRGRGATRARVVERIGPISDPRTYSLIAISSREIPTEFSPESLAQAAAAGPIGVKGRTDLRDIPLVTIDGADARDYDDAVWAEPDADGKGGWQIVVAIADVAAYVKPGEALDRDAYERGTSVYFPDRVVPMLPEEISNGWCSLLPDEDRPCLAVRMTIDKEGNLRKHVFMRGLMRSAARLTYDQVQKARDGYPDEMTAPLMETVIEPLYGAYKALTMAREKRGTLDLDLPELAITIGEDGHVAHISPSARYDSHKLIEEFMIAANVAAAESLEARGAPVMYRAHETPSLEKLEALRQSLAALDYKLIKGAVRPIHFSGILQRAASDGNSKLVNDLVLRSQSKAVYSPDNPGHFGLALQRYCHFTSPIRRYPDLLVHRALIAAHKLGDGGLPASGSRKWAKGCPSPSGAPKPPNAKRANAMSPPFCRTGSAQNFPVASAASPASACS
ncbi:MAG: RNB domain-containing ribonuclease [Proteobacteria bacterium]|nr:RNB domain-containing ribonuclease [Pseudomonadota bacterium]